MNIEFTSSNKLYRIRRRDSRNLVFERRTPSRWHLLGYHNAYSLKFAILHELSNNLTMITELKELFEQQNRMLEKIEIQLTELLAEKGEDPVGY